MDRKGSVKSFEANEGHDQDKLLFYVLRQAMMLK